MKLDYLLTPYIRIDSIWIKELNVRPQTIKIREENIGSKIPNISCSTIFSDTPPPARETSTKNKQTELHQTNIFFHSKGNHQQNERTAH